MLWLMSIYIICFAISRPEGHSLLISLKLLQEHTHRVINDHSELPTNLYKVSFVFHFRTELRFASNRTNTVLNEKTVNNAKHHLLTKTILPDVSI